MPGERAADRHEFYRVAVPAPTPTEEKQLWRRWALDRRRSRPTGEIAAARAAIVGHLRAELAGTSTVCGYLPLPTEPLSPELPALLLAAGTRVLVPLTRPGAALDWADYTPELTAGPFGIPEPTGPALGPAAAAGAEAVLIPALLVDARGTRLGRGGGHYDRTLPRLSGRRIAVLFDDELVDELPAEDFDAPVTAVVTPGGGLRGIGR